MHAGVIYAYAYYTPFLCADAVRANDVMPCPLSSSVAPTHDHYDCGEANGSFRNRFRTSSSEWELEDLP